ncbi:hypothetical protein HGM15179_017333 [Zosterops borbonicus]|uniref:G-protein coupled receptors family 3 profile domain-containing protein n=1 Tax=Zosterops borbonicus TaxID=364589 RepID=A0A8K1LDE3_9PASS|nr:hypothetical protein HGM15179_017333 [Zosterops borbonicus]
MGGRPLWGSPALLLLQVVVVALTAGQRPQESPPAPPPSGAPTLQPGAPGDGGGSAAALLFLRSGDAERLARANCSGAVAAGAPGSGPPPGLRAALRAAPEALAHAANFLNMLFQTNDIREASVAEDVEWYQALVRSLAEGHPWVRRAVLALDAHPLAPKPRLMLQATRGDGQILLQDVSSSAPGLGNLSWDNEWFNALKSQREPALRKRVLSNDLSSLETPKWQRGDSYVGEPGHVRWSPPFLECRDGRFLPAWAVTLSSAFYGLKPDLSPEFKGVVRVDVELREVAMDQCSSGPGWFSDTHRCDLNSTQCVPQESRGFVLGRYLCRCKPGFYGAGGVASAAWAGVAGTAGGSRLGCRPCPPGCVTCQDDTPCLIQEDPVLRAAVLSCQACCMLAIFLSMLVAYHFRRSKRIRTSGIVLLETILFGSLLLYFPVFILYFKPSIFRCIVLRWVRVLGFATVYGTITLKLYRVLKVFLSRSAQRAPYVSSGRVLRLLAPILLLVLWFLAAWTIGVLDNARRNIPMVTLAQTARGLRFPICGHDCWDYMMVIAEMLFLLWGSFLCYATRAVPSAFHEPRYMGIALHNELLLSAAFHVVRFLIVPSLHPDWTLLLFFAHTHGTITMTLALLFIPKLLHSGSPLREEITAEVYEDELDMRRSGSCLNSSIASAWSERSLDPDDIREELKKLYRQLEAHRTWRMETNNPHLGKSLARSILRRGGAEPAHNGPGGTGGILAPRGSSAQRPGDPGPGMRGEISPRGSPALSKARRGSRSPSPPEEAPPGLEGSDSDSLDAAPLLCRSASAQNLAGPWQRPPGRPPGLHKSRSVVGAGAREGALLAALRAARRERWHSGHPRSEPGPGDTGTPQSPPGSGAPQDTAPPGGARGHKHVTYAPVKSVSVDSARPPRRVRVTVRKTPPAPPVRYQSLQRQGTLGDSSGPPPGQAQGTAGDSSGPPPGALAQGTAGDSSGPPPAQAQGTAGDRQERGAPPAGKARLLAPSPSSAHVCPWELVQDEILSRRQRAAEPGGDTATTGPGPKPAPQKSFRSLGLAIKALNRSRGKSGLKGKSEGSLRKRGSSRREKSGPAETPGQALPLGGLSPGPAAQSPERREVPELQHNNNAACPGESAAWGDRGTAGHRDSPAGGTGHGDKATEEPTGESAAWGDRGTAGHRDSPAGGTGHGDKATEEPTGDAGPGPPSPGHQGAQCPQAVTRAQLRGGDEAPAGVTAQEGTPEQPEGPSQPREQPEKEEQPPAKARAGPGPPAVPAGRAALLRQEAIAPPEDGGSPESPEKELEKGSREAEPERGPGSSGGAQGQLSPGSSGGAQGQLSPGAESGSREGFSPGKGGTDGDSQRSPGLEKPAELHKVAPERAEGSRAELGPGSVRAQICPWDTEQDGQGSPKSAMGVPGKPQTLPTASSQRAGSTESKKANICPWEVQDEPRPKPEIGPGEGAAAPAGKERRRQDTRATSKGEEKGGSTAPEKGKQPPGKALPKSPSGQSQSLEKAEICPWESQDLKPSDKAEICPWESQDSKSSDKAEICPWEVAEPQAENRTAPGKERLPGKDASKALEKSSKDRESICPWESLDTEQPPAKPQTGSSALPKAPSGKPQSSEKAEICPWEVESTAKAEICPWEVAATQMEKGTAPAKGKFSGKEVAKAVEKSSKERESICPWESPDTEQPPTKPQTGSAALPKAAPGQPQSSEKAEICPWEVESTAKAEICPWEVAATQMEKGTAPAKGKFSGKEVAKAVEKSSKERESICPWESPDTEQPPTKPQTGSAALPKAAPGQPQSSEKAEICPWEVESTAKAEICPWEVAATQMEKGTAPAKGKFSGKEVAKAVEKSSKERESICPWESLETEQPPAKPQTGSSALPKAAPGKSQSTESLKAEICPWESQDSKSSDKAEICPWEVAEPQVEKGTASGKGKLAGKVMAKAVEKSSKERESICPWESPDTEQPPTKPQTGSAALPKAAPGQSQSSEKAEICPWEVESTAKAEICPWEVAATQMEKGTAPAKGKFSGKEATKAVEKSSKERESICPWESLDTEQPLTKPYTGSSALPKAAPGKSQNSEKAEICPWEVESSSKAEICPWESQDSKSSDKAEICPWEVAEPQPEKGTAPGKERLPGKEPTKGLEKSSKERESICPWESLDTEQPLAKPQTGSSALPKAPSGKPQSSEKAEICPWESQDSKSSDKAEICPWEVAEPPSQQAKAKQVPAGGSKGDKRITRQAALASPERSLDSRDRESICPWESLDTEQPLAKPQTGSSALPKAPSGKPQSSEKAEICPWESQDSKSSDKAEICPWEVAEPPSQQAKAKQVPAGGSKGDKRITRQAALASPERSLDSRDRESICPWESLDTEQSPDKPHTGSSALPKAPSGQSQSLEKAEICPWESQDLKSSDKAEICPWESQDLKSSDKAEICPWEVAEPQVEKGTASGKGKDASKAVEKSSKDRESICPWESPETEQPPAKPHTGSSALPKSSSGKSRSLEKAEICPWESQDLKSSDKAEICPWEVAEPQTERGTAPGKGKLSGKVVAKAVEKSSKERESICPWESSDMEQPPAKPHTGSSALPKAPSGQPQSTESLKAEICPWEVESSSKAEICPWESQDSKSSDKAEICPWEVAEPQPKKGTGPGKERLPPKEPTKALEKGSKDRESICPWESLDTEQPPAKPQTGSSALPKAAPGKSQSSEKAEICPWESQDSKSSDKAEICPWEVAEPQLEKGTGPSKKKLPPKDASKALEKGSRDQESICPWESPDTEELSLKTAVGQEPSKKSDSTESRKSEICPWEAAEPLGVEEEISQPDEQPQGAHRVSSTGMGQAGASAVSPTLVEKSRGRSHGAAEHKPLCRLLPSSQHTGVGSSSSPSTGLAEVCPWEAGEAPSAPAKPSPDTRKSSEVCPWEEESTDPSRSCPRQGRAGGSPRDGDGE